MKTGFNNLIISNENYFLDLFFNQTALFLYIAITLSFIRFLL